MSDELQAAVERYREYVQIIDTIAVTHNVSPYAGNIKLLISDATIIADAYLAHLDREAKQAAEDHGRGELKATVEGIYVASRASIPERAAMWRNYRDRGVPIVSSWIDEDGEGQTEDLSELWTRIEREVKASSRLVLYAEADDFPLKGAYIEVGMAIAIGIPVVCVLPGVSLEERSLRPLGSWAKHPLVSFADINEALGIITK